MQGLGTIVNMIAIIVGGLLGITFNHFLKESYQETIMKATGVACIFLGISSTLSKMLIIENNTLSTTDSMPMIISLALGGLIGELLDIEGLIEKFGTWLKVHTGNAKDKDFTNAFVTASLTVCVGAMAIIGAIQDGLYADHSVLFAKAILDFIIIMVMASTLGKGCIFSFIPVGLVQGLVTIGAIFLAPLITTTMTNALSLVGNILIFCVGLNLIWPKTIRVANLLPSLVIAIIYVSIF